MFDSKVYTKRRETLRNKMSGGIIFMPSNPESSMNYLSNTYSYRQDSTFSYFFGIDLPDIYGIIDIDNGVDYIFGNDYTIDDIIWMGTQPTIKQLADRVGVTHAGGLNEGEDMVRKAVDSGRAIHYINPYRATVAMIVASMTGYNISDLKDKQSIELIKAAAEMRLIKEDIEIEAIEKQVDVAYMMHTEAMKIAHEGKLEREIAGTIEGISLKFAHGVSFPVICTINGQTLHNHYHGNILKKGRMLVCDAGSQASNYYSSDITRSVPVGGKFDQRQKEIYEIVLQANLTGIASLKPGITYLDVHKKAVMTIVEGLKTLGIMKGNTEEAVNTGAYSLFMPHGLGHALGLDVHDMENYGEDNIGYTEDAPRSTLPGLSSLRFGRTLNEGNIMTIEPGIYFIPDLINKFKAEAKYNDFINFNNVEKYLDFGGIRIEDDVLVTNSGSRVLGQPIPKTISEIETIMN